MHDAWHVDPYPKSSRGHNVWVFTPELSLKADFALSKKVSIAVLGIPMVIVIS